ETVQDGFAPAITAVAAAWATTARLGAQLEHDAISRIRARCEKPAVVSCAVEIPAAVEGHIGVGIRPICAVRQGTKAVQDSLVVAAGPIRRKLIDGAIHISAAQLGGPVEVACAVG